ncbi:MAG: hypothetical protein Q9224_006223 [Gallowayella concinna]
MKDPHSQGATGGEETGTRSNTVVYSSPLSNYKTSDAPSRANEGIPSQKSPAEMKLRARGAEPKGTGTIRTLASAEPEQLTDGEMPVSEEESEPWFERAFLMALHLPDERPAKRVTCLDGCSDFDVISQQVVDDFKLHTQPYTGVLAKPLGDSYNPEGEITLSWHVSGFHKTYTTTFVVFNHARSELFDILLGRFTIKKVGFYKKAGNIWLTAADDQEICLSEAINTPDSRD